MMKHAFFLTALVAGVVTAVLYFSQDTADRIASSSPRGQVTAHTNAPTSDGAPEPSSVDAHTAHPTADEAGLAEKVRQASESTLISGRAINGDILAKVMKEDTFSKFLDAFERENSIDARVSFQERDRFIMATAMDKNGNYLNRLVCGKRVCLGQAGFTNMQENEAFMKRFLFAAKGRMTFVGYKRDHEVRFLYAIDENIDSVTMSSASSLPAVSPERPEPTSQKN